MSYKAKASAVLAKLKTKGAPCNLLKPTDGMPVYDEATDSHIQPTTPFPGCCLVTSFDSKLIDGTAIKYGDVKILCAFKADVSPDNGADNIVVNPGTTHEKKFVVINSKALCPDGRTNILFTVQGRQ